LFDCIDSEDEKKYGALTTITSTAATKIFTFAQNVDALCFSTNFDDYLAFNLDMTRQGMSIFNRENAEKYFIRTQRDGGREKKTSCIYHANADVFWLCCSGDNSCFCPKTDSYYPAFTKNTRASGGGNINRDLKCDICGSNLHATMTMPGTYKKDYDTREMVSMI